MTFERIHSESELRDNAEQKEGQFDRPVDVIVSDFFDGFIKEERGLIEGKAFGILGNDLESKITRLIEKAESTKNREFAEVVAREVLACLDIYRPIIADEEDSGVKKRAKDFVLNYIVPGGEINPEEINLEK